jgi:hypothetical protein
MTNGAGWKTQKAVAIFCALLLPVSISFAQALPPGPPQGQPAPGQPPAPLLSPEQLANLVAPVALYPDPLLGQLLAASTYPLEVIEVQQWLKQHTNLQGAQLMDAVRQMNWDPSVQALVAFPNALNVLSDNVQWTTDLGNAFLAQQADVMSAVQRMRARASANGKLASTPQQVVTTDTQDGQSAIEIQPADPQEIYVPNYQPDYVYGPPALGAYPDLWYPPDFGFGFGFGFGPGIYMGGFFPGWGGWGGWGWGCGWFGGGLFVNAGFFNRYGFGGRFGGAGLGGRTAWAHDPGHRMGVPYPNRAVASRFNSTRYNGSGRVNGAVSNAGRTTGAAGGGWRTFNGDNRGANGDNRAAANRYAGASRQAAPNQGAGSLSRGSRTPAQSYRGSSSAPRAQSYSAPRSYLAPRQSSSAPRSFSGGGSSGARSFSGGGGGGHAGFSGGGGHAGGGGRR